MPSLDDVVATVRNAGFFQTALWSGLGVGTLVLVVALRKRWREASPLYKCTVFSVWFHLLLVVYATSFQVIGERQGPGSGDGRVTVEIKLSAVDGELAKPKPARPNRSPDDAKPSADPTIPQTVLLARPQPASSIKPRPSVAENKSASAEATPPRKTSKSAKSGTPKPTAMAPQMKSPPTAPLSAAARASTSDALVKWTQPTPATDLLDEAVALPSLDLPKPQPPLVAATPAPAVAADAGAMTPIKIVAPAPTPTTSASSAATSAAPPAVLPPSVVAAAPLEPDDRALPPIYQQRVAADRERIAALHGGSKETEAAVRRALRWLAANQEADGRWDASRFGSGRETQTLGQNRGGAGTNADTGITGLALLALLGAGHTHRRGDYQATVARGLEFLAASQHLDGNVAGSAEPFAFMYSHGMATLALSEALAMTGDEQLRPVVERAIGYTLRAQNRTTGGWRYRPGDTGDMSQLGWQLMALKSAELAGLEFPTETRHGIERFTLSVSSGTHGGIASYRPQERPSRPMTAEALVVRQFLGTPRQTPALDEAGGFLLDELPGVGQPNYYYWYYGTLGMYQLQGEHWRRWNDALTRQLLGRQVREGGGDADGSWDPNDVWGGYGGRVYSTALATLCLEVYYRYLPLYVEAAANGADATRK